MDRKKLLSNIKSIISPQDRLLFLGTTICSEYNGLIDNNIALMPDSTIDYFSIMLGMAMSKSNRFFCVCEDNYLLRHFTSILQIAASKCINIFIIILVTEEYSDNNELPTIYSSLRSTKGIIFNAGILSHDYTAYLKNKTSIAQLVNILHGTLGPVISLVNVEDKRLKCNLTHKSSDLTKFFIG